MKAIKIILGILLLFGGIRNLLDVFQLPNARQAAGYLAVTFFFLLLGGWLLYSGIRKKPKSLTIYDGTENGSDD